MKYGIFPDLSQITVDWTNFEDDLTRNVLNFTEVSDFKSLIRQKRHLPAHSPIKFRINQSLDLSQSCSFSLSGKHYIVGGDTSQGSGRRNLEVDLSSNKLIKLQNLPIDFSGGSCVGSNSDLSIAPQSRF